MPEEKGPYYTESEGLRTVLFAPFRLILKLLTLVARIYSIGSGDKDFVREQVDRAKPIILQHLKDGGVQEKIDKYLATQGIGGCARPDAWQELVNEKKIRYDKALGRWVPNEEA